MLESIWDVVVPFLPTEWQGLLAKPEQYKYVLSMPGQRYFVRELSQIYDAKLPAVVGLAQQAFFGLKECQGDCEILVVKRIMISEMDQRLLTAANVILRRKGLPVFEKFVYYVLHGICGIPHFRMSGDNLNVCYDSVTWKPTSCFLVDRNGSEFPLPPVTKEVAVQYVVEGLLRAASAA